MKLLLIDTETTDADPEIATLLEVGVALYDTVVRTTILQFSLLLSPDTADVPNPGAAVTGLTPEILRSTPCWAFLPGAMFDAIAQEADAFVAYNAAYDRKILARAKRTDLPDAGALMTVERPWICAKLDLRFPYQGTGQKLSYLAVDHGLNPTGAHRALADVQTLADLLALVPDLEEQIADARRPRQLYVAQVSFADKDLAKARGFAWDAETKSWFRELSAERALEIATEAPFPVWEAVFETLSTTPPKKRCRTICRVQPVVTPPA